MSDEETVSEPGYQPPRASLVGMAGAVFLVVVLTLPAGVGGLLAAAGGTLLVGSVLTGLRRSMLVGIGGVFAGVLVAGVTGTGVGAVAIASAATVVAYDAGHLAIDLGTTMRERGTTTRAELTHIGGTTVVAAGAAAIGYTGYEVAAGGQPATTLVALLFAGLVLLWALRSSADNPR